LSSKTSNSLVELDTVNQLNIKTKLNNSCQNCFRSNSLNFRYKQV